MFKTLRKMLSIVLVLTLVFNLLPLQCFSVGTDVLVDSTDASDIIMTEDVSDPADEAEEVLSAQVVGEDVSRRDEFYKEFVLDNGLRLASVYPEAVHFEKDGAWEEIDNTLVAATQDGVAGYTNTAGVWSVHFPAQLSGANVISVTKDGYTVSFGMAGALRSDGGLVVASIGDELETEAVGGSSTLTAATAQLSTAQIQAVDTSAMKAGMDYPEIVQDKLYSRLSYPTVYSGTNVVYDLSGNRLKESVILSAYDDGLWGYRYSLDTGDLVAVLNEDQSIDLVDADGEVVLHMPAPFLVDDAGEYCYDIDVALTQNGDGYTLAYYLPRTWLAEADRAWPVVLDPTIEGNNERTNIQDITVAENATFSNNASSVLCGYDTTNGIMRTFLRFKTLPCLTSAQTIVSAKIMLTKLTSTSDIAISVHQVDAAWDASTITWSNKPTHSYVIEDLYTIGTSEQYTWDITSIARGWYSDTTNTLAQNTGMMFKSADSIESGSTSRSAEFCSSDYASDHPILTIVYRDVTGLESYWDATSSGAGRAGTGYVNHYSGNLVWTHSDMGFSGLLMPVSIQHIYNTGEAVDASTGAGVDRFGMGYGWRSNYHQLVSPAADEHGEDDAIFVWTDGDGTRHSFISTNTAYTYTDTDDLGLTLTSHGSDHAYEIVDRYGNISGFDSSGRLVKIQNNQEQPSSIDITYQGDSNRISQITDGVGRKYSFTYASNLLTGITFYGTGTTALDTIGYEYSSNKLVKITYADSEYSTYSYSGARLTKVTNIDGTGVDIGYHTTHVGKPSRVTSLQEFDGTSTGATLSFAYSTEYTKLTDHKGRVQTSFFNDYGNTISTQDDEGVAQFTQYATDSDPSALKNRVVLSSQEQNSVENWFTDISFENGEGWTALDQYCGVSTSSSKHYHGNRSMKLSITAAGSGASYGRTVSVAAGQTICYSAYVWVVSGNVSLQVAVGSTVYALSSTASGNTGDWVRLEVVYTNNTSATQKISPWIITPTNSTVEAYVDCVQLEFAKSPSRFNLVEGGDFTYGFSDADNVWTVSSGASTDHGSSPPGLCSARLMLTAQGGVAYASQTIYVSGDAGDEYVLGGWAMGNAMYTGTSSRFFGLRLMFHNTDGSTTLFEMPFKDDLAENAWQYVAAPVKADKAYSRVSVSVQCRGIYGTLHVDGVMLFREGFGTSYEYDAYGNVEIETDILGNQTTYEYASAADLYQVIPSVGPTMTYQYDIYHNVETAIESVSGVTVSTTTYEYDEYGNNKSVTTTSGSITKTTTTTFTDDNNQIAKTVNNEGKTSTYNYDLETGQLLWYRTPEDTWKSQFAYDYDAMHRVVYASEGLITSDSDRMYVRYVYTDDQLTQISKPGTNYNFAYGSFNLVSSVSYGTQALASYTYSNDGDHLLTQIAYSNGDKVGYSYDDQGRIVTKSYYQDNSTTASHTVTYTYNKNGDLASEKDTSTGTTTRYYYDDHQRLVNRAVSGNETTYVENYIYDGYGRLLTTQRSDDWDFSDAYYVDYSYDEESRVKSVVSGQEGSASSVQSFCTYDDLDRVTKIFTKNLTATSSSTILTGTISRKSGSDQITSIRQTAAGFDTTYSYTYDDNGDIATVSDGTYTTRYTYDGARQLVREDNQREGKTWTWTYDPAGNILAKTEYAYTTGDLGTATGTISYGYSNSNWGDLLTSYNSETITYDTVGNPLSYNGNTYTWKNGRQLASIATSSATWTFSYDTDGLRTKRAKSGTTYTYEYAGSQLTKMTVGSNTLYFTYSVDGKPCSVNYNGTTYYYVTNLQGDVVEILNASGATVTTYTYDAWGRVLTSAGSLSYAVGQYNPLRYRGYVYDVETGLYYLQSRYYDPAIGRFISADAYLSTGSEPLEFNMFAYCQNNPIMGYDPTGCWNWGGFWTGVAIVAVGVAIIGLTVATAGAASTLAATAVVAIGTGAGVATIETGVAITAAAVTDSTAVIDISYTDGMSSQKYGYSAVIDYGENTLEVYSHYGATSSSSYSITYGAGIVNNYNNLGDYGGDFVDVSASMNYKGIDYGIDGCWDPDGDGTSAVLGTVGISLPPIGASSDIVVGYDYYAPCFSFSW